MRLLGCGGRKRRLGPLDLAVVAAIHRPQAHPFLAGLRRRLEALEPAFPWGEPVEAVAEKVASARAKATARGRALRFGIRLHTISRDTSEEAWAQADRLVAARS